MYTTRAVGKYTPHGAPITADDQWSESAVQVAVGAITSHIE